MTSSTSATAAAGTQTAMPETLAAAVLAAVDAPDGPALRFRRHGRTVEWGADVLGVRIRALAAGLVALGIAPGDRVAILAGTRPEWTLADCAILCAGAVTVPIYHSNSPEEWVYVLQHSGARAVVCEDAAQVAKVAEVRAACPELEHVFAIEDDGSAPALDDLARRGAGVDAAAVAQRTASIAPDDVATIVYTSGTTGPPKGCTLTHANCVATMWMYERRLELGSDVVLFLFLPLAHVLARLTQFTAFDVRATVAFWSGDGGAVLDDLAAMRPTHLPSVPRVFEKIHTRAVAGAQDASPVRRALFDWALRTGRRARAAQRAGRTGRLLRLQHAVAGRLVLSKVRALFGGDLRLALTGAAPIAQDVLEFFDACGLLVVEAYGMTESCAAATANTPQAFRFGTVGRPCRGPTWRSPTTARSSWRPERLRRLLPRRRGLSGGPGRRMAPHGRPRRARRRRLPAHHRPQEGHHHHLERQEHQPRQPRGGAARVALDLRGGRRRRSPALPRRPPRARRRGGAGARARAGHRLRRGGDGARRARVRAALQEDVDTVNRRFARVEQIKRFAVLEGELTQAGGDLTPTLKVKRAVVGERHAELIDALYA